jgi:hypothetical protein
VRCKKLPDKASYYIIFGRKTGKVNSKCLALPTRLLNIIKHELENDAFF